MTESNRVLSQSEYEQLLEEIRELQARIAELTALRDDLVYHVCPALSAEYEEKIVSLERELIAANMYLREKQRIIEILQAQMNQQQKPSYEKAETKAKEEFRKYEDDLKKKAEEARKRKEKWEKENQWSSHDREEKKAEEEARKNRANSRKDGEDCGDGTGKNGKDRGQDRGDGQDGTGKKGNGQNEDGQGRSGQDGDGQGGTGQDGWDDGAPGGTERSSRETPGQKIKKLYRKIVKRLHPDMHPNPTEHEKELFNRATAAYEKGNLEEMERIWEELSGMDAPEDLFDDTAEGRAKLRELLEKLKLRMSLLTREIEHIKSEFPYKIKSFLEDEEAVEECRRGLRSKIDQVREMDRQLAEFIEELKEKLRKGERA